MIRSACPIRHLRVPLRAGVIAVAFALGGCSSFKMPERFEIPANSEDFRTRVYAGAGMGNSHLTPDTRGTVFNVDDTDDLGTQIKLGVDMHNSLALELETSVLGTATLREARTDVNYSAASVSALIYGLNGVQLRSRREGWSAYGRLGLGILKKSSAVLALDEGGTVPIIGAGAEFGLPSGLGLRGEITRFDEDAIHLGLGAVYRFGLTPREVGGLLVEVADPALSSKKTRVADGGRTLGRPGRIGRDESEEGTEGRFREPDPVRSVSRWRPPVRRDDRDHDGIRDATDRCPDTNDDVTVDRDGCGLFDAVLSEVVFKSGSNWLTARARAELDDLADRLLVFPEARVRVLAHTDSTGPADENLALSARRAEAVVQYLEERGVSEMQLEGRGLGETRPVASNRDPEGRARNRRIDIETLANVDAFLIANTTDDRREPVRWKPPEPVAAPVRTAAEALSPASADEARAAVAAAREPAVDALAGGARSSTPAPGPNRMDGAPSLAAATPVAAKADGRVKSQLTELARKPADRPMPLPRPGFVAGLDIGGPLETVRFAAGTADLLPDADAELAAVADELRRFPDARVAIMAHTDDRGSDASNLALSEGRAASVRSHLVELGIDSARLTSEGHGARLPLVQNVTDVDRARNRRVELRIVR